MGDAGAHSGLDITGVYFARNASTLFVRIDRAGPHMPDVGAPAGMWVFLDSNCGAKNYGINLSGNDGSFFGNEVRQRDDQDYNNEVSVANNVPMNTDGESIEFASPLSAPDVVGQYSISIYTHFSEEGIFSDNGDRQEGRGILSIP